MRFSIRKTLGRPQPRKLSLDYLSIRSLFVYQSLPDLNTSNSSLLFEDYFTRCVLHRFCLESIELKHECVNRSFNKGLLYLTFVMDIEQCILCGVRARSHFANLAANCAALFDQNTPLCCVLAQLKKH